MGATTNGDVVLDDSIGAVLRRQAHAGPNRDAIIAKAGRWTYRELDADVDRAVSLLSTMGLRPGERIAVSLPNDIHSVVLFLAAARAGLIWVGVSLPLAAPEKLFILNDSGARAFFAERDSILSVQAVATGRESVRWMSVGDDTAPDDWLALLAGPTHAVEPSPVTRDDIVGIGYTSGTTGFPKGAIHSHQSVLVAAAAVVSAVPICGDDRYGVFLSLNLLNMQVPVVFALQAGACAVIIDVLDPRGIAEWVSEHGVTAMSSVPTILYGLARDPGVPISALSTLRTVDCGGASVSRELATRFRQRFGLGPSACYGMTEGPYMFSRGADEDLLGLPGYAGRPLPHVAVHIRDAQENELDQGESGEICISSPPDGPWSGLFKPGGYWGRSVPSVSEAEASELRTGDIGYVDEAGNLYVRDRKTVVIIRGGANVYPAEVERVLMLDRRVVGAVALGLPDDRLGERVVALVEVKEESLDDESLRGHLADLCTENLARYKRPEAIRFTNSLPRTTLGKVVRQDLAELFNSASL